MTRPRRDGFAVLCLLCAILMARANADSDSDTINELNECFYQWDLTDITCSTTSDIQQAISCLNSTIIAPDPDDDLATLLTFQQDYLDIVLNQRDVCPHALNQGSCLKGETLKCQDGYDTTNCTSVFATKKCLEDLKASCNTSTADAKIDALIFDLDCPTWLTDGPCSAASLAGCVTSALTVTGYTTCTTQTISAARQCLKGKESVCSLAQQPALVQSHQRMVDQLCPSPSQLARQQLG